MTAKKFSAKMVAVSSEPLAVTIDGVGEVEIELHEASMDRVLTIRKEMAKAGQENDLSDNVVAMGVMFLLTTLLVRSAVKEELTDDEAVQLITKSGGIHSDFVKKLCKRFGVSDILNSQTDDDGGLDVADIPT